MAVEKVEEIRKKRAAQADRIKQFRFPKGVSGNPGGRPKKKPFTEAVLEALEKDPKAALAMVVAQIKKARKGDTMAFRTLRDTVQGKPLQEIELHGDLDAGLTLNGIEDVDRRIAELLGGAGPRKIKARAKNRTAKAARTA